MTTEKDQEFITFLKHSTTVGVTVYSGRDKETGSFVSVILSLEISGYGDTQQEADEMLESSLQTYIRSVKKLSVKNREIELMKTGWRKAPHKRKEFRPYNDSKNKIKDFNFDGKVASRSIKVAA